jgi:ABC-2 type transport system permease protein
MTEPTLGPIRPIRALIRKDLLLLARDRGALFLTFAWPLVLAIFFGALGPGFGAALDQAETGAMTVLVVDDDRSGASAGLLAQLDTDPRIALEPASLADARERVRSGASPAYVHVPAGFGQSPAHLLDPAAPVRHVELGLDPRRKVEAELLAGATRLAAARALATELPGTHEPLDALVLDVHSLEAQHAQAPPSPYAVTFPQGIIWAVLACAATFAVSLVDEHKRGTLLRLAIAPVPRLTILLGKAGACLIAIVFMQLVLLTIAALGFAVRPHSPALLVLALASTALGFTGLMTLLAVLGRRTSSAAGLSWAVLMLMAMLGGGMLPLFLMPSWLQVAAQASPVAWALVAIEGAVWRGASPIEVALPCAALLLLGGVCLAIGSRTVREL